MANDFRSFNVACDAFTAKVKLAPGTVQKRIAFDLFGRIIKKTPVDTGRARASWTIAGGQADRAVAPVGQTAYPIPQVPLGLPLTPGEPIWISNNLPYIVRLEEGHSKQAPAGMVAVSIAEVEVGMRQLITEGLKDAGL